MEIEKQIIITYRWWNNEIETINPGHLEALEESAMDRIIKMMGEGMTSGELNDNIRMHDSDPENGIPYRGWFKIDSKTL